MVAVTLLALQFLAGAVALRLSLAGVRKPDADAQVRASLAERVWIAAMVWFLFAVFAIPAVLAVSLNIDLSVAARPRVLWTFAFHQSISALLLLSAGVAIGVAVLAWRTRTGRGWAGLAVLAFVGLALPGLSLPHSLLVGDHGLTILAGVLPPVAATAWIAVASRGGSSQVVRWIGGALAVGSISLTLVRIPVGSQIGTYWFVCTGTGIVAAVLGLVLVRSGKFLGPGWDLFVPGLLVVVFAGLVVQSGPPGSGSGPATTAEGMMGDSMPAAPTLLRLFAPRSDSLFLIATLGAAFAYLHAVRELRANGKPWASRRSGFFIAGLIGAALVTLTDIGRYSPVLFSVHMAQHTMLNMLTPLLLALGAPLALALENSRLRGTGVAGPLQWFATSRAFAVATKPVVALGVYTLGLFGLYFSPAFPWLMGGHLGHELMLVFFLVTGYLFYASILALDPLPSHPTLRVRLLEVVLGMVVQWIFGVVVMLAPIAVSGGWFRTVQPPWLTNLHRDQFVGGGIAAMSTQICDGIIVMFALLLVGRSRPTRKSSATISPDADVRG